MAANKIGLKDAISIGIGGMVGGGIFAVLGLAVSLAKGGTPLAFLFAGLIALFTAYSYAKLSLAYTDRGGTVKFINEGFGKGIFSGGINNLLWISYIIMHSPRCLRKLKTLHLHSSRASTLRWLALGRLSGYGFTTPSEPRINTRRAKKPFMHLSCLRTINFENSCLKDVILNFIVVLIQSQFQ